MVDIKYKTCRDISGNIFENLRSKAVFRKERNCEVSKIFIYLYLKRENLNGPRRCGVYKLEIELFWKIRFHKSDIVVIISCHPQSILSHSIWGKSKRKEKANKKQEKSDK